MKQLTVGAIVENAFRLWFSNIIYIWGSVILWLLTLWVPYVNLGATIGLFAGLPVAMSKGKVVSPTDIFDPEYRKAIGEFLLLLLLYLSLVVLGFHFLLVPGCVISIAYGQGFFLLLDKHVSPIEALALSNKITYGKKWTIFGAQLLLGIVTVAVSLIILVAIYPGDTEEWRLYAMFFTLLCFLVFPCGLAAQAYIYRVLSDGTTE